MLLLKALHLVFMVTWFAGLFYLPRLFVYHAMSSDAVSIERFKTMERKLYFGIMTPGAVLTLACGFGLALGNGWDAWNAYLAQTWFQAKLLLLLLLAGYHGYCGRLLRDFRQGRNQRSHKWYRWFNEIPVAFLAAIVLLAVYRPA